MLWSIKNSASAYTPEYYYFNMDSLHKSLQRGDSFYPIKLFSTSVYHPPASLRYYLHWTHGDNPIHWCNGMAVAGGIDCYPEGVNNTIFDYNNGGPKANA